MQSVVYVGIKGAVIALDRKSGEQLWLAKLKGGDFVNVMVDGDIVLAVTKGQVFCLRAETGDLLWNNSLPGQGLGLATIATANGSTPQGPVETQLQRQGAAVVAVSTAAT